MNQVIKDIYMYVLKYSMKVESTPINNEAFEVMVHNNHRRPPQWAYKFAFIVKPRE